MGAGRHGPPRRVREVDELERRGGDVAVQVGLTAARFNGEGLTGTQRQSGPEVAGEVDLVGVERQHRVRHRPVDAGAPVGVLGALVGDEPGADGGRLGVHAVEGQVVAASELGVRAGVERDDLLVHALDHAVRTDEAHGHLVEARVRDGHATLRATQDHPTLTVIARLDEAVLHAPEGPEVGREPVAQAGARLDAAVERDVHGDRPRTVEARPVDRAVREGAVRHHTARLRDPEVVGLHDVAVLTRQVQLAQLRVDQQVLHHASASE